MLDCVLSVCRDCDEATLKGGLHSLRGGGLGVAGAGAVGLAAGTEALVGVAVVEVPPTAPRESWRRVN